MEATGKLVNISRDWQTGQMQITFTINEPVTVEAINNIAECEKLNIKAVKYRKRRSLNANALLWECIGKIAGAVKADKWDIYLQMLKRYGKFTHICVKPSMVDAVKAQWRECEVLGDIEINGRSAVQMLCYFGSSTYDSKEFSVLLDGVISEMQEMGLETPLAEDTRKALEQWGQMINEKHNTAG